MSRMRPMSAMDTMKPMIRVQQGRRYRLVMDNHSGDEHPVHMHRHTFGYFAFNPTSIEISSTKVAT